MNQHINWLCFIIFFCHKYLVQTMLSSIFSILIIILVTFYYFIYAKPLNQIKKYVKNFEEQGYKVFVFPFNPFTFPIFQTMLKDGKNGDALKTYKEKFPKYDIIVGNIFSTPAIAFLSPDARKQFAKNQIDFNYQKMPLITDLWSKVLGHGLVFSQGSVWKSKRRIVSKFFTYDFINSKISQIYTIIEACLDQNQSMLRKSDKKQNQCEFQLITLTARMFSNVILSIFLGTESLEQKVDGQRVCHFMIKLVNDFNMRINQTLPLMLGSRFLDLGLTAKDRDLTRRIGLFNQWASKYIDNIILHKTKQNSGSNLLYLLHQTKESEEKTQCYDKKELIDELKIFFFAGTDTTSHFLQMMIYLTMKNSQVNNKAREQTLDFKLKQASIQTLKQLNYIDVIQKQTVRFYGPLPIDFPRKVVKGHYFKGVPIQAGTVVQYISTPTHFNPQLYIQPLKFSPERWINQKKQFDAAELTGFGMGPRSCIGQYLAHVQSKIAFALILSRYKQIVVPETVALRWKSMYESDKFNIRVVK